MFVCRSQHHIELACNCWYSHCM